MLTQNEFNAILRLGDGLKGREELRSAVRRLQQLLGECGYSLVVDGFFGPRTDAALRAFQRDHGLPADGVAGAQTWDLLVEKPHFPGYPALHPFLLRQLDAAQPYRSIAAALAKRFGLRLRWIAGVCSRESAWGLTLRPPGPGGTGDWMERSRLRAGRSGLMPSDGLGYGRGLMQIDYDAHEFARTGLWMDAAANLEYGCSVLRDMRKFMQTRTLLDGESLTRAMLAAYNAGPARVLQAVREGRRVDDVTTGKDYSADVLCRAAWFSAHGW